MWHLLVRKCYLWPFSLYGISVFVITSNPDLIHLKLFEKEPERTGELGGLEG